MEPNYIQRMTDKRTADAQRVKEQSELQSMLAELKKMQMASLMGQSKPSVVLTDQTDLGDKIKELTEKLVETVKSLDTSEVNGKQVNELVRAVSKLDDLNSTIVNNLTYETKHRQELLSAIKALKLSTVVNVPDLPAPNVDLSSLESTMRELWETPVDNLIPDDGKKVDMDCYKAQDIKEEGDTQYVGFTNQDGAWYIIENDVPGNKMRYVFGTSGYANAFSQAATFQYKLLHEAVDAL